MRKVFALFLAFMLGSTQADAAGVLNVLASGGKTPFTPVTHTYTSGGSSGTETIPNFASQVVITTSGAGGGGACAWSGGNGGKAIKTLALTGADWGVGLPYAVGQGGLGAVSAGSATNGTASTASGTVTAGSIALSGNGGGKARATADGIPGTATGGDTNTTGGGAGGGGIGDCTGPPPVPGSNGNDGSVSFAYT